jgi:hypothetical protein
MRFGPLQSGLEAERLHLSESPSGSQGTELSTLAATWQRKHHFRAVGPSQEE